MDAMVAAGSDISIEQVLDTFATTGSTLPRESMRWALDNWAIAAPHFIALLEACSSDEDQSATTSDALFFALHLLAEKQETRAFQALCRLLRNPDRAEAVLGDAITTTLKGIIISTFDGNADALKSVIEGPMVDEFVRGDALDALSYLVHTGRAPAVDIRSYLQHLSVAMRPRSASFIWASWAFAIARLGYADLTRYVARAFRLRLIERHVMGIDQFRADLKTALDDPTRMAGFKRDDIAPFDDAIGTLATWHMFSKERRADDRRRAEQALFRDPAPAVLPGHDPFWRVGRNEPCPCGSGKKYKRCCRE